MTSIEEQDVAAFVDRLIQQQKTIDSNARQMADDIVSGQRLANLEDAKLFARNWIVTAAQYARNEEYSRDQVTARDEQIRVLREAIEKARDDLSGWYANAANDPEHKTTRADLAHGFAEVSHNLDDALASVQQQNSGSSTLPTNADDEREMQCHVAELEAELESVRRFASAQTKRAEEAEKRNAVLADSEEGARRLVDAYIRALRAALAVPEKK